MRSFNASLEITAPITEDETNGTNETLGFEFAFLIIAIASLILTPVSEKSPAFR
jgi:hypothetical protein